MLGAIRKKIASFFIQGYFVSHQFHSLTSKSLSLNKQKLACQNTHRSLLP